VKVQAMRFDSEQKFTDGPIS